MKHLLVGLIFVLLYIGPCIAEDVLLKNSALLVTGYSILPFEAPVKILFRDSSLVVSAGGPDTDYRDLTIIPYQDVRTMKYGEYRQGNESAAILISPLFALHTSQKRLFSLSYMAPDSIHVLNIFLAEKDKVPFIQGIEKRTGKKTVIDEKKTEKKTETIEKVEDKPGNTATTKADSFKVPIPVTSEPPGADIYVDEMFRGSTPSTISLVPGDHSIRITRPGYIAWERKVQIEPSGNITLNAVLEKERPK